MWNLLRFTLILLGSPAAGQAVPQLPSMSERQTLEAEHLVANNRVRGGSVEARWLDDGSSFLYRAGGKSLVLDPASGEPRRAKREDRARVMKTQPLLRAGQVHAPNDSASVGQYGDVLNITLGESGESLQLGGAAQEGVLWMVEENGWSMDGTWLAAIRRDSREVHHLPIVDYSKAVETVERVPYIKAGTTFPGSELALFQMPSGRKIQVGVGSDPELYLFTVGWREGTQELLYLRMNRSANRLDLMAANTTNGESRVILTDTQETFV